MIYPSSATCRRRGLGWRFHQRQMFSVEPWRHSSRNHPKECTLFFLFVFYHVLVCVPPPWSHCHPKKSVNMSASRRNPAALHHKRGNVDIRCQGPTAEISMATQEYVCIFQSSPFQLHCLHSGRVRCTQTHFSCHIICNPPPYKTKTVERYRCPPLPFVEAAPQKTQPQEPEN